jgi:hypothetical protein
MYKKDKVEHFQSRPSRNLYILLLVVLSVIAVIIGFFLFKNPPPAPQSGGMIKLFKR